MTNNLGENKKFLKVQVINLMLIFLFQPIFGSGEASNKVVGKFKLGSETLATLEGKWDQEIYIKEKLTGVSNKCPSRLGNSVSRNLRSPREFLREGWQCHQLLRRSHDAGRTPHS